MNSFTPEWFCYCRKDYTITGRCLYLRFGMLYEDEIVIISLFDTNTSWQLSFHWSWINVNKKMFMLE